MRKSLLSGLCALGVAAMTSLSASAAVQDFVFTYDYEGAEIVGFGIGRNVGFDVAMLLKNPSFVGSEILGVSIDIPYVDQCTVDPTGSAWLTRELKVEGENNVADIITTTGEVKNYGTDDAPDYRLDITFSQPYTVTEDGVYVGYSLLVTNCNRPGIGWSQKYPISLVTNVDQPESFMIHTTQGSSTLPNRYPAWTNLGANTQQALSMRVLMRGDVHSAAASIEFQQTLYAAPETLGYVYANLTNAGSEEISSIEYTYTVNAGTTEERVVTNEFKVEPPLAAQTGSMATVDLPFVAPTETGNYKIDVTVTKVNGEANGLAGSSELNFEVVPFLPVNTPVVADYTGLWCGNCPAVYVAARQLRDKYGEEFLSVAYHCDDNIQGVPTYEMPNSSYGIPKVYLNRESVSIADIANITNLIETPWLRARRELAPASIEAKLFWADDDRVSVIAQTEVSFVYDDSEADYRIAYAMIEDGMSDPSWAQRNYFTNESYEGDYWDLFCGKPFLVTGIVYDDVILNFPNPQGVEGSVPTSVESGKIYRHESTLNFADAVCRYNVGDASGKNLIKDRNKIRVVAMLIDAKTGLVRNAATTGYTADASVYGSVDVVEVVDAAEVVATEYYSLAGLRLGAQPAEGAYIIVNRMADGTVRTVKAAR